MALDPKYVAQILYQAGWRDPALTQMVAIAGRESRWNPAAHRTPTVDPTTPDGKGRSGDFGLFQLNYIHDQTFKQSVPGYTNLYDLLDPVKNAQAALVLYNGAGFSPWKASAKGFDPAGNPTYGTNMAVAQKAVAQAQAEGLLGKPFTGVNTLADINAGLPSIAGSLPGFPGKSVISGVSDTANSTVNTVGTAAGAVVDTAKGAVKATMSVAEFLGKLSQPTMWIRIIKVVGGAGILGIGIYSLVKDTAPMQAVKKGVTSAAIAA
jgi:hypothetical protein